MLSPLPAATIAACNESTQAALVRIQDSIQDCYILLDRAQHLAEIAARLAAENEAILANSQKTMLACAPWRNPVSQS